MIIETYGPGNSDIGDLAVLGNILYFRTMNGLTRDLWKTDDTIGGTVQVAHPDEEIRYGLHPQDIMTCNGRLFFSERVVHWVLNCMKVTERKRERAVFKI